MKEEEQEKREEEAAERAERNLEIEAAQRTLVEIQGKINNYELAMRQHEKVLLMLEGAKEKCTQKLQSLRKAAGYMQ